MLATIILVLTQARKQLATPFQGFNFGGDTPPPLEAGCPPLRVATNHIHITCGCNKFEWSKLAVLLIFTRKFVVRAAGNTLPILFPHVG